MGVIRAEPARITDWAAKSVGAAWRVVRPPADDLRRRCSSAIGLVMAYTNSVESGTCRSRRARRSAAA